MPKWNVKFLCRFEPGCMGGGPREQERSENLYADDAAGAEAKARAWWTVVEFHGAKPYEKAEKKPAEKKPKPTGRRATQPDRDATPGGL